MCRHAAIAAETAGKNVYPAGIQKGEITSLLSRRPELSSTILHLRSVVRRSLPENVYLDLLTLRQKPALATLHPGLLDRLSALQANTSTQAVYAVPYSVAYSDDMVRAHGLLHEAADAVDDIDPPSGGVDGPEDALAALPPDQHGGLDGGEALDVVPQPDDLRRAADHPVP